MTFRHAAALAAPLERTLPRLQLAGAAAAAVVLVVLSTPHTTGLQLAGLALATTLGTVLEDPAAPTVAAAPLRLYARRAVTLTLAFAFLVTTWAALVALGRAGATWTVALTIQLAGLSALVLALAAALGARAATAGPAIVLLFVAARLVVPQWTLATGPHDPHWHSAQLLWAAFALAGGLALAWLSRDPGRPPVRGREWRP